MGIPCYFVTLVRKFPKLLRSLASAGRVDNLYLDANSIVYDVVRRIAQEKGSQPDDDEVVRGVEAQIRAYVAEIDPQRRILVAFDGVAPRAKTAQQKERRFRGALERQAFGKPGSWDTCKITPGTPFMDALMAHLAASIVTPSGGGGRRRILLSSSSEAGEGEHKIFAMIRSEAAYHAKTRTMVYGLDADLVMLSVLHARYCSALSLYRETPHFIRSISRRLDPTESYALDARTLADRLGKELRGTPEDYVVACFLLGNDFLPHFPSVSLRDDGHAQVMLAYRKLASCAGRRGRGAFRLVVDGRINWPCMRDLVRELAAGESAVARSRHRRSMERGCKTARPNEGESKEVARVNNIPTACSGLQRYIDPGGAGWRRRYCLELLECNLDSPRLARLCAAYVQGLEWTLAYYTEGCKDWMWVYPGSYAPPLSEVEKAIPDFDMELVPHRPTMQDDVCAMEALQRVIPAASAAVVPEAIRDAVATKDEGAEHLWAFARYFWEASVQFADERAAKIEVIA
jgi:5'-3' exoribonuclease 1